ncbi:peptidoglycan editing factor PgeF [Aliidiomarina minuta]|uniref:Purine nucleoside phosphorylase n=1 Tax=Aliidiomarina minuta TaxID=880057 RepID=A0A432W4U1_9GAMM|nr:peptidoglycan editing factor PgeF [Aliidiomarina minuta]RUO24523.1 peptidoglycan editing factor PgeF [Aliidiomarina minuta]
MINTFKADWPVINDVQALTTSRHGGVSVAPYGELNLATHVGDLPAAVQQNRRRLVKQLQLPDEPNWLSQTHSTGLVRIGEDGLADLPDADAAYTQVTNQVLVIMSADCLPVFLATRDGRELALVHAGWRGMASGIIKRALRQFEAPGEQICAWLGPAIGADAFEVGEDVRSAMLLQDPAHEEAFKPFGMHWKADLYKLARQQLGSASVGFIGGGQYCTYNQPEDFYSHRRDGTTGRMASLLWRS